jgi:hypothetical protein
MQDPTKLVIHLFEVMRLIDPKMPYPNPNPMCFVHATLNDREHKTFDQTQREKEPEELACLIYSLQILILMLGMILNDGS